MEDDKRKFQELTISETRLFVDRVYDLGFSNGQESAWVLTCLLHNAAYISTVVAVTANKSHNDGSVSDICKAVTEFLIDEIYENVKNEVMN